MANPQFTVENLKDSYQQKVLNQALSLQEFNEKKLVLKSTPSKAIVELTENCNFKCVMCPQAYDPKYAKYSPDLNMSLELFDKIAKAIFPNAYFIDLRGFGESVILPHWPEVLDRLERYPLINWHLVTNLSVPRDQIWDRMIKDGFILGFSCDAATKKTFESIRVRSHFEKIIHNLEVVSSSIKSHKKGFLYFIVTVQKQNIEELSEIVELANRYGVNEVQFKIVRNFGYDHFSEVAIGPSEHMALKTSLNKSIDRAIELGVRLTINDHELLEDLDLSKLEKSKSISITPPNLNFALDQTLSGQVESTARVAQNQKCFKPFHYTYFSRDGKVGTCNHMMYPAILEMGDLSEQSFEEIWNGDNYQTFRKGLVNRRPTDSRCQWCFKHRAED